MSKEETLEMRKLSVLRRIANSLTWKDLLDDLEDEAARLRRER